MEQIPRGIMHPGTYLISIVQSEQFSTKKLLL